MIVGVYKITSPSGKIYIGQSVDIERRFNSYKNIQSCKNQIRLYNSFIKYGVEGHIFEVLEKCSIEELNIKERFYQEEYSVIGERGLNCRLQGTEDKSGLLSDDTKDKLKGKSHWLGRSHNQESKNKMSSSQKGRKPTNNRLVLDTLTGVYYESCVEASKFNNINRRKLNNMLLNFIKNRTNLEYV